MTKDDLLLSMREYLSSVLEDGHDPDYSEKDIRRCESIIDTYLRRVRSVSGSSEEQVLAVVKSVVIALNELNDQCNGSLIETDQREMLCELILSEAKESGLISDEDVTESWREW